MLLTGRKRLPGFSESWRKLKIKDVSESIAGLAMKYLKLDIDYLKDPSRVRKSSLESDFVMDCSKVKKILGWSPRFSFDEALEKTFLYYMENS